MYNIYGLELEFFCKLPILSYERKKRKVVIKRILRQERMKGKS